MIKEDYNWMLAASVDLQAKSKVLEGNIKDVAFEKIKFQAEKKGLIDLLKPLNKEDVEFNGLVPFGRVAGVIKFPVCVMYTAIIGDSMQAQINTVMIAEEDVINYDDKKSKESWEKELQ